jgi:hypothetical protein
MKSLDTFLNDHYSALVLIGSFFLLIWVSDLNYKITSLEKELDDRPMISCEENPDLCWSISKCQSELMQIVVESENSSETRYKTSQVGLYKCLGEKLEKSVRMIQAQCKYWKKAGISILSNRCHPDIANSEYNELDIKLLCNSGLLKENCN